MDARIARNAFGVKANWQSPGLGEGFSALKEDVVDRIAPQLWSWRVTRAGTRKISQVIEAWNRRSGLNRRPADYESYARLSKFNNFKDLGVQDAAKRVLS